MMELTPKFAKMDFSEDSGCGTASSMEISSAIYESTPSFPSQSSTSSFFASSRKRKTPFTKNGPPIKVIPENGVFETPRASPWYCSSNKDFLSSTLNESRNVENFVHDHLTPNFYLERDVSPPSNKQPIVVTPPRPTENKLELNYHIPRTNSSQKLGSPERNEILYPNLKHFGSAYKPPTPQKFAESLKRYTPAKKRLFGITRREKTDPVAFFLNDKHQFRNIVDKIFDYLGDKDLYNVRSVSLKWREAIACNKNASKRLDNYMEYWNLNKENMVYRRRMFPASTPASPKKPPSPRNRMFNSFMEVKQCLKEGQTLNKCPKCNYPSIIDQNISQCQRDTCRYICCTFCNSFSTCGPEKFIDRCQTSKLVIEKPEKTKLEALLSDSPMKEFSDSDIPSFFMRDSPLSSSMLNNTSGYITDSELTYCKSINAAYHKEKVNPLQDCNRDLVNTKKSTTRRSSWAPVVPINTQQQKQEILEPSSPPKIKCVRIGSKASKKNLKRLFSS